MSVYASIDLGSNTVRLLVVRKKGSGFESLYSSQQITRLAQGLNRDGNLIPQAMDRTVEAIARLKQEAAPYKPEKIWIAATSAVRKAKNRETFINRVRSRTGLDVEVIPWEEEGRRTLLGVHLGLKERETSLLIFDIGGGSTEFILSGTKGVAAKAGTDLGVVRLTEKHLKKFPVDENEFQRLNQEIRSTMAEVQSQLAPDAGKTRLVGTAGTATTIAALDLNLYPYDPQKINGHKITRKKVNTLLERLKKMTLQEILSLPPMEKGREDLIVSGLVVVKTVMESMGFEEMIVSDYGLREGILLHHLRNTTQVHGSRVHGSRLKSDED